MSPRGYLFLEVVSASLHEQDTVKPRMNAPSDSKFSFYPILNIKSKSEFQRVEYGVTQGSILGPIVILIYANDLPKAIKKAQIV